MNNHGNTVSQKENDNSPETKLKATKDCYLNETIQNSCHKETKQDTKKLRKAVQ